MLTNKPQYQQSIENGSNNNQAAGNINIYNTYIESNVTLLESIPIPDVDNIKRIEIKNKISDKLDDNDIIQVYGISGIGKTELIKMVLSEKNNYDKKYWISCSDDEDNISLDNIPTIAQNSINILETIKSNRTLIVVDNYNAKITNICEQFRNNNTTKSKLIIISKEKSDFRKIEKILVEYMTLEEATEIFQEEIFQIKEFKEFLETVDKHPMTLQILKNYLTSENGIFFTDIKNELNILVNLEDSEISSSQKICEKIIGCYYTESKELYNFLSLFDSNIIESDFLKKIILADIQHLINKNFIKYEESHYYMHSIIIDSIKSIVSKENCSINYINQYTDKVLEYLEDKIKKRDLFFYRFCGYNNKFLNNLEKVVGSDYYKVVIYNAYITINNYHEKEIVINDIKKILSNSEITRYYEVKLLTEQYEMELSCIEDKNSKKMAVLEKIQILESKKFKIEDCEIKELITQRIAKFYNWIGDYDKSTKLLEELILLDSNAYSSILQLCRAYRQIILGTKEVKKKEEYIEKTYGVLKNCNLREMPMPIILEIIRLIVYRPFNEEKILKLCLWDNFDLIENYLKLYSDNKIFEHIYLIMGSLASNLYYNKKEFYKEWFENIEHPNLKKCDKRVLKAMIDIYCYEVKRRIQAKESLGNILECVINYWRYYKGEFSVKSKFEYKSIIDCLISNGNAEMAEIELDEVYDKNDIWHLRYRSKIEEIKGNYTVALEYIQEVLNRCDEKFHKGYLSTFENDKEILVEKCNNLSSK